MVIKGAREDLCMSQHSLVHAIAGAVGSVLALSLTYPLYITNISIQSQVSRESGSIPVISSLCVLRRIYRKESLRGLFKGLSAALVAVFVQSGLYYFWFSVFCQLLRAGERPFANMAAGLRAGAVTVLMTNPLWVINARQITRRARPESFLIDDQNSDTFWAVLKEILREEGVGGLYSGVLPSLALASNPAILFFIYAAMTRWLKRLRRCSVDALLPPLDVLCIGALSKLISTIVTYPLQIIKINLQQDVPTQPKVNNLTCYVTPGEKMEGEYRKTSVFQPALASVEKMTQIISHIYAQEGLTGFFRGLSSKLLQTACTFIVILFHLLYDNHN